MSSTLPNDFLVHANPQGQSVMDLHNQLLKVSIANTHAWLLDKMPLVGDIILNTLGFYTVNLSYFFIRAMTG